MLTYTFGYFCQQVFIFLKQKYSWSGPFLMGSIEFEERGIEILNILLQYYNEDVNFDDTADKIHKYLKSVT